MSSSPPSSATFFAGVNEALGHGRAGFSRLAEMVDSARSPGEILTPESSAVQAHAAMLQGVISRMAENSRSCKLWSVTLVAASLVLASRLGEPRSALAALIPAVMLMGLDAYYLWLERDFRRAHERFAAELHAGELRRSALFQIQRVSSGLGGFLACVLSPSVGVFHAAIIAAVLVFAFAVLPGAG